MSRSVKKSRRNRLRKQTKRNIKLKQSRRVYRQRGGGRLPFLKDSIVITPLEPEDPQSPPVAVSKEFAEKEIYRD